MLYVVDPRLNSVKKNAGENLVSPECARNVRMKSGKGNKNVGS